jgi:hypothetical protein
MVLRLIVGSFHAVCASRVSDQLVDGDAVRGHVDPGEASQHRAVRKAGRPTLLELGRGGAARVRFLDCSQTALDVDQAVHHAFKAAESLAAALDGKAVKATPDDMNTPNSAIVLATINGKPLSAPPRSMTQA